MGGSPSNRAKVVSAGSTDLILLEPSFILPDWELVCDDEDCLLELDWPLKALLIDMSVKPSNYDKDSDNFW